jgi:hypothetical protein
VRWKTIHERLPDRPGLDRTTPEYSRFPASRQDIRKMIPCIEERTMHKQEFRRRRCDIGP